MSLMSSGENVFIASLVSKELSVIYNAQNGTLRLITKDADFMSLVKRHVHEKTHVKTEDLEVSTDAIKEYTVIYTLYSISYIIYKTYLL